MPSAVIDIQPAGFPWKTYDPFLFCVFHRDAYPSGNADLGPAASLAGRSIGQDFEGRDGWRMYHGSRVPGFPQHPHRGFETVTIMRSGVIDHSDSLGATARFGPGDVQWLTAGQGIVHSEMFPLLDRNGPNPLELFQIWLNLPGEDKMVPPHFAMLWDRAIHTATSPDGATRIRVVAGRYGETAAPEPPPRSWASRADTDVAIWTITMDPGATWTLPRAAEGVNRAVYPFSPGTVEIHGVTIPPDSVVRLDPAADATVRNGAGTGELLLLQGRPIGEPVVQYGPFVMNSRDEIQQAIADYQRTSFGGWPWPVDEPVLPAGEGRYARHADGRVERQAD